MKNLIIALVALLVVGALAAWALPYHTVKPTVPVTPPGSVTSSPITLTGVFACLPHKGNGPSTMECAYGMKGNDGMYYALDWSGEPTSAFDLPMGQQYSVTGMYVPVEAMNSDHWQVYDIKGVIKVTSYAKLPGSTKTYPVGSSFTVGLKDAVAVGSTTMSVQAVLEDSRCPSDVVCIQAGRARIALTLESPSGISTSTTLEIGKTAATEALAFTLDRVTPYPVSTHKAADSEYRFVFTVKAK